MLEIEDLTIIWPGEISESQWEQRAKKEFFKRYWAIRSTYYPCLKHERCTRTPNHLGPCMAFKPQFEVQSGKDRDKWPLSLRLNLDAIRIPLDPEE